MNKRDNLPPINDPEDTNKEDNRGPQMLGWMFIGSILVAAVFAVIAIVNLLGFK